MAQGRIRREMPIHKDKNKRTEYDTDEAGQVGTAFSVLYYGVGDRLAGVCFLQGGCQNDRLGAVFHDFSVAHEGVFSVGTA